MPVNTISEAKKRRRRSRNGRHVTKYNTRKAARTNFCSLKPRQSRRIRVKGGGDVKIVSNASPTQHTADELRSDDLSGGLDVHLFIPPSSLCSPRHSGLRGSRKNKTKCLDVAALTKVYNAVLKTDTAHTKSEEQLRKELSSALEGKCSPDDEVCWVSQHGDPSVGLSLKTEYFKPTFPMSWINKPNTWLDNFTIDKVLRQYENAIPNFLYLGALSVDFAHTKEELPPEQEEEAVRARTTAFEEHPSPDSCVEPSLCVVDITKWREQGIQDVGAIINLDLHTGPGTHWVGMIARLDRERAGVYYYDSYGVHPPWQVREFLDKLVGQLKLVHNDKTIEWKYNNIRHQFGSSECGMFSIYFLLNMLLNRDLQFDDFIRVKRRLLNDGTMQKMRKSLMRPPVATTSKPSKSTK